MQSANELLQTINSACDPPLLWALQFTKEAQYQGWGVPDHYWGQVSLQTQVQCLGQVTVGS